MRINLMRIILVASLVVAGCSQEPDPYARERALPTACWQTNPMDVTRAQILANQLLPTAPITVATVAAASSHQTLQDRVTGRYTITLVNGHITGLVLAHELAHVAVLDAFRNTAPPGQPSTEKWVAPHGEEFFKAYKSFMTVLVSSACAEAL